MCICCSVCLHDLSDVRWSNIPLKTSLNKSAILQIMCLAGAPLSVACPFSVSGELVGIIYLEFQVRDSRQASGLCLQEGRLLTEWPLSSVWSQFHTIVSTIPSVFAVICTTEAVIRQGYSSFEGKQSGNVTTFGQVTQVYTKSTPQSFFFFYHEPLLHQTELHIFPCTIIYVRWQWAVISQL